MPEAKGKGKILVIRGGAVGDFILTLPALAALRAQFPNTHLEVLGYSHIAQLAQAAGIVDGIRSIEAASLASFFASRGELAPALCDYFASFALIVSYLYDPDEIFQTNIRRCSKAQFIQGPHRPDDSATHHATDVFLKPLERLAIFDADPVPRLPLTSGPPGERLALHPGSGSERKNWPEAHWAELIRQLSERWGRELLLVAGEAEEGRAERLARHYRGPIVIAAHETLPAVARRLSGCRLFVGHDSGITHLAAAVGLRGLVLWGPSVEQVWRPRSERMQLLRADNGLANLAPATVLKKIEELLKES